MLSVRFILCFLTLLMPASGLCQRPEPPFETKEEAAAEALRRLRTNLQYNKDGTVRLVRLSKPTVTNNALAHVRHFSKLDYLAIACPLVTDEGIAHIADLTQLDTLLLSQSGISGQALSHLSGMSRLERLYLADTQVDDEGLRHIGQLAALRVLSLERTPITDAGVAHVAAAPGLETLLLSGTQITDDGLRHLKTLEHLRVLFLDGTPVTAAGLRHLHGLSRLEHLNLSRTSATDVDALSGLAHLKHLQLWHTGISAEQLQRLHEALPSTAIHAPLAAANPPGYRPAAPPAAADFGEPLKPVRERLADGQETPDFQRHVIPLLGRLGCNGRACHGSFQGQGGFRLSMFGYDFDMDHENLTERIDLDSPADSLLLNMPASEDEHGGGLRLPAGGWEQGLLARWISAGAPGVMDEAPRFVRLEVTPAEIVFQEAGETAKLHAVAVWSDGTREDVTCLTRFVTNDETVAKVSPDGVITAGKQGDTYVISFYDNGIFSTQVLRPVSEQVGKNYPSVPKPTRIDELVVAKLAKLGMTPRRAGAG